jgi:hypothetical protein
MGLLTDLLGGMQPQAAQDFVQRYQQGAPSEGYSNQEVQQRYEQVAPQLSPGQFQQAAQQSFQNLSPDQRMQFGQLLQQQAQQAGYGMAPQGGYQDPQGLAQFATQVHQQDPSLIGQLLGGATGGGGGGVLGSPVARAAIAGIAAMAMRDIMGGNAPNAGGFGGGPML